MKGAQSLPRVTQVVPNLEKDTLVSRVLKQNTPAYELEPVARAPLPGAHLRTRAFIKVQDGCDNYCTFCITRLARGKGRSRSVEDVLTDVRMALEGGAQEVVLTGVHLGSWGQDFDAPAHLRSLVERLLQLNDLPRLRLSSLEPWDLDEAFFSLWSDGRLCRHLHLPLQSGCAVTLRRMARKTTPESFAALVESARRSSPDIAITTDVIAGFPGETEAEFEQSLAFIKEMRFAGGHAFTYSARPGTRAARMGGQVPFTERKRRNALLREVFTEASQAYGEGFIGSQARVLWESTDSYGPGGWQLHGLTDNYLHVTALSPEKLWNTFSNVRLDAITEDGLSGEILS